MAGYSGETSFDFEIERYKDKESGKLIAYVLSKGLNLDDDFEYEYQLITLKVEGRAYYTPGRTYGPPENCYPDEGEVEVTSVIGPDGQDWEKHLTHSERDSIEEQIQEQVINGAEGPDPDDYDEPDFDDRF